MADNTTLNSGTGGDIISSDVITTLNGSTIATGEKAQRMKLGFGSDSVLRDVDASNPLPVTQATSIPAGTNIIGNVGSVAVATGGYTPNKIISAASTNATSVKASAGTLGWIATSNTNAAARYLKVYNKASAPTVGTDVPVATILIPGNAAGAGNNPGIPGEGLALSSGIAFAITTGVADGDTGAVAANEVVVNYGTI